MNNFDYFKTQFYLEGYKVVGKDRFKKVKNPDVFDIEKNLKNKEPKLVVLILPQGKKLFYNQNLSLEGRRKLSKTYQRGKHSLTFTFRNPKKIKVKKNLLIIDKKSDPFLREFYSGKKPPVVPAFAVKAGNKIASVCISSREDKQAGEAWVFTKPKFRRKGYASLATKFWASYLFDQGKIPFYTHKIDNLKSQKLAKGLKLEKIFEEIVYD